jgi:replication fork protection complex subunit Tof1/Swi1
VVKPDNEGRKQAMFKDNKLRLLMTLAGFERIGLEDDPEATWIVPSSITSTELQETYDLLQKHRSDPKVQYGSEDNPKSAEDMLQRKSALQRRVDYDDDSEGDGSVDNEILFAKGGPTVRKSDALAELKKRRRLRRASDTRSADDPEDEERRRQRRKAKALAELEKMRKIKSDLMVHSSDEEDNEERDREFFAREEQVRKSHGLKVLEAIKTGDNTNLGKAGTKRKRGKLDKTSAQKTRQSGTDSDSQDEQLPAIAGRTSSAKRARQSSPAEPTSGSDSDTRQLPSNTDGRSSSPQVSHLDTSEDEAPSSDTPVSSPQIQALRIIPGNQKQSNGLVEDLSGSKMSLDIENAIGEEEDDDDDLVSSARADTRRVRGRAAVLVDSDED